MSKKVNLKIAKLGVNLVSTDAKFLHAFKFNIFFTMFSNLIYAYPASSWFPLCYIGIPTASRVIYALSAMKIHIHMRVSTGKRYV